MSLEAQELPSPESTTVSSPSLARLLHSTNSTSLGKGKGKAVDNGQYEGNSKAPSISQEASSLIPPSQPSTATSSQSLPDASSGLATTSSTPSKMSASSPSSSKPKEPATEPLSEYTCPICFCAPSNATLTPCGHICCGSCLFAAVKTSLARNRGMPVPAHQRGGDDDPTVARCPVCRAGIPGWDGKGGGVIGLKIRAVFSL
ncbi:hypothetical protein BKA70DRAFT_1436232 [Coprinopsis sp. MPI-PUGE-AT-0042]|nr:hypothetical protein BKA70DRAFT_1436232 [Coprinopsis sp. MPI-PUGE-AT-0042]